MKLMDRFFTLISDLLKSVGALALTLMMLITAVDVIGRYFKHPIFGSVEIVGFLAVAVTGAALPHTYKVNGHVGVEIVTRFLPRKVRLFLELFTRTLTLIFFSVVAWQMFVYAKDMQQAGEVSMNLEFPLHYIVLILAVSLAFFSGTILQQIVDTLNQLTKGQAG
ncbi:MAG: C4-dicarboxylate ABC transporter permease [Desulfobacter postgatei]|uniref:C4-dicarboxylate ABC transporter permease n=1 Tax=Desulfobacter postgatei TaxID=2293 RepID=A0A2G6MQY0_9BACT|nr:MAG: C4-dicarboxylate ABC transporter permease [Desulfobacter postgatei]